MSEVEIEGRKLIQVKKAERPDKTTPVALSLIDKELRFFIRSLYVTKALSSSTTFALDATGQDDEEVASLEEARKVAYNIMDNTSFTDHDYNNDVVMIYELKEVHIQNNLGDRFVYDPTSQPPAKPKAASTRKTPAKKTTRKR